MDMNKVIDNLNTLIEICRDGQQGFKQAAENVKNVELKRYFDEVSLTRARMAGDLQAEVNLLGGTPEKQGSVVGALHRTWFDVKAAIGISDESILASVESEEDKAINTYEKVLKEDLPANINHLVNEQYASIRPVHSHVRALRDSGLYKTKRA